MDDHQNRIIEGVLLKSKTAGKILKTLIFNNRFVVIVKKLGIFEIFHQRLDHTCYACEAYTAERWSKEALFYTNLKTIKDAFAYIRRFS